VAGCFLLRGLPVSDENTIFIYAHFSGTQLGSKTRDGCFAKGILVGRKTRILIVFLRLPQPSDMGVCKHGGNQGQKFNRI